MPEKRKKLAKPIAATPVLKGSEANEFLTRIHEESNKPSGPTPTPNLHQAQEMIKKHAESRKKLDH